MTLETQHIEGSNAYIAPPINALLLDDSAYDRTRIKRLSQKMGMPININEVPSISAMMDSISRESFDLIMVDYRLAEGDGLEALDAIREQPLNRNAAIIMISGDEQSKTAVSAFRQGCHDFVAKRELSADVLQESVSTAMRRSRLNSFNEADLADMLRNQVQQQVHRSMNTVIEGGFMQTAIADGMFEAAKSVGLEVGIKNAQDLLNYSDDDEFIFLH